MAAEVHVALNIPCVANEDQPGRAALPSLIASHIINSPGCSSTRSSEDGEKVSVAALQKAALQRSLSLGTNAMIARLKQHGVGEVDADQVVALLDELDAQVKQLRDDHAVTRRERRVLMLYGALVALVSLLTVGVVLGVGAWFVLHYSTQVQNSILGTTNSNSQGGSTDMSWMRPASSPAHARKEYEWQYVADRMDLSQVEAIVIWPYSDSEMLLGVNGVMRLPEINLSGVPNPLSTEPSPLDVAADNQNTLAITSDLTDPTSQPASLVFNTALGVLRVNKNTLSVMNVDILDALEAAGVPTCRNPKGDRTVASGLPPCEIMIPPRARVGHQMHAQQQAMQYMSAGVRSTLPGSLHTKVTLVLK